ncbi:OsmC family peroxiredoxin [Sphingobacterium puteale]|uniref:OsmC family peroxiredoxin n=1 Tax=Sphingobacterium puteale TaxID=2420510 RepID=A0A420VX13_9SPHI|nr:OsmC family protein [Sphingobacterium puteale]RKO70926.1 OsmC family peroxiredoxin [Sphingobacterium puteale]
MKEHQYKATVEWTGNLGSGTDHYNSYERSHLISVKDKVIIQGSSDPAFRGNPSNHNPEELLLASLSSCHMLWYLHLCSVNNIVVEEYIDHATGKMIEEESGKGFFKEVTLSPAIRVQRPEMIDKAIALHKKANEYCFIANSMNFPVLHQPHVRSEV